MPRLRLAELRQAVHMLWDDQEMDRCLGIDVSEGQTGVVLVYDGRRNLLGYDLIEYCWPSLACCPAWPCASTAWRCTFANWWCICCQIDTCRSSRDEGVAP